MNYLSHLNRCNAIKLQNIWGTVTVSYFKVFICYPIWLHWYSCGTWSTCRVFSDISTCLKVIWWLKHSSWCAAQTTDRFIFVWSWDSFIPLLMTGQTGEQLRFGPSLSNPAAPTKTPFNLGFYLHKSASFFCVFSFFPLPPPPFLNQIREKKNPSYSNRDRTAFILTSSIQQSNCVYVCVCVDWVVKLNQSGVTVWEDGGGGGGGGDTHCCQRGRIQLQHDRDLKKKKKVGSESVPALCRLHFLLLNLHQPPHNNMADPACGTGATQLETRIRPVQLIRERRGDEKENRPSKSNHKEIIMWERKRSGAEGGFMEKKEDSKRPLSVPFSVTSTGLYRPLLALL